MATGAERARRTRERRMAEDLEAFRAAERRRYADYYSRTAKPKPLTVTCAHCGDLKSARGLFCPKPDCKRARNRERQRRYMHERRARLNSNEWEAFEPREVYDRDGWVCGLCALPVDPQLTFPDPGSVSLDHIAPVSLGGPHTRANTRCAHLGCNSKRGNRTEAP